MQEPLWVRLPLGEMVTAIRLTPDQRTCEVQLGGVVFGITDALRLCCETRYMVCDDNLAAFVGSILQGIEVVDGPETTKGDTTHEVQFLRLITTHGTVTISNHNEHNGYYDGFSLTCACWSI